MSGTNLAQHEQYLKSLESSLKQICDYHHQTIEMTKHSWNLTLQLFATTENLRKTRSSLEKEE